MDRSRYSIHKSTNAESVLGEFHSFQIFDYRFNIAPPPIEGKLVGQSAQKSRMCGRYRRTTQEEELARLYHVPIPKQTDLPVSYNIGPSQKVLTIRFNPETQACSLDALQ